MPSTHRPTSPTLCPVLKRSGSTVICQRACHGVAERRWVLPADLAPCVRGGTGMFLSGTETKWKYRNMPAGATRRRESIKKQKIPFSQVRSTAVQPPHGLTESGAPGKYPIARRQSRWDPSPVGEPSVAKASEGKGWGSKKTCEPSGSQVF